MYLSYNIPCTTQNQKALTCPTIFSWWWISNNDDMWNFKKKNELSWFNKQVLLMKKLVCKSNVLLPVHSARKFSAVLGATSWKSWDNKQCSIRLIIADSYCVCMNDWKENIKERKYLKNHSFSRISVYRHIHKHHRVLLLCHSDS